MSERLPESSSLEGSISDRRSRWITFEMNQWGQLHIRTIHGAKVIEDPKRSEEILRLLLEVSGMEELE